MNKKNSTIIRMQPWTAGMSRWNTESTIKTDFFVIEEDSTPPTTTSNAQSSYYNGATITLNPALVGPQSVCGHTIAGIAFDGVVYWVGEAHDGLLQCLSSWVPNTGRLNATTQHFLDHRGLHWVPGLGRLTSRTWGGPISAT